MMELFMLDICGGFALMAVLGALVGVAITWRSKRLKAGLLGGCLGGPAGGLVAAFTNMVYLSTLPRTTSPDEWGGTHPIGAPAPAIHYSIIWGSSVLGAALVSLVVSWSSRN
jgi:hypothetical protein